MFKIFKNTAKYNPKNILFYFFIFLIISLGIYTRTKLYSSAYPFWLDESMLSNSFIDRSYLQMFYDPLVANQKAPPLFCVSVLFLRKLFGLSEYTLRFIPYISGILSLFLFFKLLKENIGNRIGIVTGEFIFATSVILVFYSSEFKPYSSDVLMCILLMIAYKYVSFKNCNTKQLLLYTICSILCVLYSFPSLFIIPSLVFSKFIEEKKITYKSLWILSGTVFAGVYLYLYDKGTYDFMKQYWGNIENAYLSFSLDWIRNYVSFSADYYIYHFNPDYAVYLILILILGFFILFKDKKETASIILFIFLISWIASITKIYPFKSRLALYFLPLYIMLSVKMFDWNILAPFKEKPEKLIYFINIILCTAFFYIFGINIPFINVARDDIIYYNKSMFSRDKSYNQRDAIKKYSTFLSDNYKKDEIILASEEFLYSLKYNSAKNNHKNITPEIIIWQGDQKTNNPDVYAAEFIHKNFKEHKGIWLFGRDNEGYFKCSNFDSIINIIESKHINYKKYTYTSETGEILYLIHIFK